MAKEIKKVAEDKPVATKIKVEEPKKKNNNTTVMGVNSFFDKYGKLTAVFICGILLGLLSMYVARYNEVAKLSSGEDIVARINGKEFSANVLYDKLKDTYGNAALIEMLDSDLLNSKYTDESVKDKVDAEIAYYKQNYGDKWDQVIASSTYKTEANFRKAIALGYKQDSAVADMIKADLTEKQINDYYTKEVKGDIKVSHIIIQSDAKTGATDAEKKAAKEKALKKAEDLIKQLKDAKTTEARLKLFAELAKKNSSDGSAEKGGDLGYISYDENMDEAFLAGAFALGTEVGSYTTKPVESSFGYHIIIKTDKDKERPTLEAEKTKITNSLVKSLLADKPELAVSSMDKFRKNNGLEFEDQVLKKNYEDYIKLAIANIKEENKKA